MFCRKQLERIAQLENALRQADAVRTALDRSMAIIELSPDGGILDANSNFCQAVGYELSELRAMRHANLCDPAYAATQS